jgi:hypothetical protein
MSTSTGCFFFYSIPVALFSIFSLGVSAFNFALNKPTWQSSVDFFGVASRAVDGNTNTNFGGESCTSTHISDVNPWWAVDLTNVYFVKKVTLFNRADCNCGLFN